MRRIETLHRNPPPDRGGRHPERGLSVEKVREDGTRVTVKFHEPISVYRAFAFADKVFAGEEPKGRVTVTETPPRESSDVATD